MHLQTFSSPQRWHVILSLVLCLSCLMMTHGNFIPVVQTTTTPEKFSSYPMATTTTTAPNSRINTILGIPRDSPNVPFVYKQITPYYLKFVSPNDESAAYYMDSLGGYLVRIKKITFSNGKVEDVLPQAFYDQAYQILDFCVRYSTGEIFILTYARVFVFQPATQTWSHYAGGNVNGDYIPAIYASLERPNSISVDPVTDELYIADTNNWRIRKVTREGIMMTVAGGGNIEFHRNSPPDMKVPATSVQLGFPSYVYAPGNGYFYLSNDDYCRIMRVSQKDGMIESVVGNGECGDFKDHTPASKSTVHMYRFVVSKFNGDMFFGGDQGIFKVALSQPDGLIYSMTSSNRSDGFSWVDKVRNPDDGTLSVKNYIAPIQGITLGSDMNAKGDLYFAQGPGRITRIVQSGSSNDKSQWKLQTLFGSKTYMIDGIPANYVNPQSLSAVFKVSPKTSSRLVTPGDFIYLDVQYIRRIANQSTIVSTLFVDTNGDAVDIASDSKDSFYYASDHLLYHYNMTSQEMKLIAGIKGQEGYSPDGNPAKSSTLGSLTAVIAHPVTGQVVFIEEQSVVRTIDSNGLLQTLAGGGDLKYKSGIPPRQASLRSPTMLQYSSDGSKLYICDQHYSVIMMVTFNSTSAPLLYIVAGSQQSFNDGQDGIPATQASLSSPSSFLVLPSSGDLLISEFSLIRRVSVKTGLIYTVYGKIATGYTPDGPFKGTSSYLVTPNLMNIDPYDGGNVIYFGDTFSNVLRSIETSCPDHSWRLDETWSSCVKCSPGTKSTKDFVYCV